LIRGARIGLFEPEGWTGLFHDEDSVVPSEHAFGIRLRN